MSGAGNPLNYDYRDPRHVERYNKLVIRHPTGETEGKHPRDADVDAMREIHDPAPLLRVIRVKCIDCSGGSESEARKCTRGRSVMVRVRFIRLGASRMRSSSTMRANSSERTPRQTHDESAASCAPPLTLERGPLPAQAFHRLVLNATAPFS